MVTRTQLIQTGGIASLQKRKQEQKIPTISVPKVSQAEIEAQKKYEQELSKYNQDMAEYGASQLVYMWATRGREDMISGLARHGTPAEKKVAEEYLKGVWKRGEALYRNPPQKPTSPTTITIGTSASKVIPPTPDKLGTIFLKPSESGYAEALAKKTGVQVSIPETKTTYTPTSKGVVISKPSQPSVAPSSPTGINPLTSQPYSIVSMPQTEKERFQQIKRLYVATSPLLLGAKRDVETVSKSKKIVEDVKKAEKITLNLDRLSKEIEGIAQVNINEDGEWTGSEKALDDYKKRVEEYKKGIEKYEDLIKEKPKSNFWKDVSTQVLDNPKLVGIGMPFTPLFIPIKKIKEKSQEYSGLLSGTFSATKELIKSDLGIKDTNVLEAYTQGKKKGRFMSGVVNLFIPETPKQVALTGGIIAGYGYLPKIAKIGVNVFFGVTGTKGALDKSLLPEERVASGIIGGLGSVGVGAETLPYMRGIKAKFSGDYIPVKIQERGFSAIESKELTIGLIPERAPLKTGLTSDVQLPSVSPLKRGGFGVKPSEKKLFLGEQTLTTSQIGFFKKGKIIKLEREFFTTPQEPFIKIPETRVSRLGLSSLFEIAKKTQIEFGVPKQPQIGLETGAIVSRTGFGRTYKIGRGTELEAIKETGTIFDIKRVGQTSIRGQGVELYEFKTGKGEGLPAIKRGRISTEGITIISGEGFLTSVLVSTSDIFTTTPTKKTEPVSTSDIFTTSVVPVTPSRPPPTKPVFDIFDDKTPSKPSSSIPPPVRPVFDIFTSETKKGKKGGGRPVTIFKKSTSLLKRLSHKIDEGKGYDVWIIKRGKPKIVRKGLLFEDARDVGTKRILKDLRATFFLKKSKEKAKDIPTQGEFEKYKHLLRKPLAGSKYHKLSDINEVWIQRKEKVGKFGGRLSFGGEKQEIKSFNIFKKKSSGKSKQNKKFRWFD